MQKFIGVVLAWGLFFCGVGISILVLNETGSEDLAFVSCGVFLFIIVIIYYCVESLKDKYSHWKYKRSKCLHGIRYANVNPSLCPECFKDYQDRIAKDAEKRVTEEQEAIRKEKEKYQQWLYNIRSTDYLLSIDPLKFEALICHLLRHMGYNAELTSATGDHGIDINLHDGNKKIAVQCKRVKNSVGEPVIRDLYGAMIDSGSSSAIIVTTGRVSKNARAWIEDKPIRIIEMIELQQLITRYIPQSFENLDKEKLNKDTSSRCPRCGNHLRLIDGKHGSFYGCYSYPKCNYTRSYSQQLRRNSIDNPWSG